MVGSKMPPRTTTAMISSFSITDVNNEVVCPLKNQDGSSCRKKCLGEKRYRSMQEHIRRAHPEHYIPKLPATEESFLLMINSPPQERPNDQSPASATQGFRDRHGYDSGHGTPSRDKYSPTPNSMMGPASAAAVLAELHGVKGEREYDGDGYHSDYDSRRPARSSMELPPLHHIAQHDITSDPYSRPRALPALLQDSPPGRSSTLPPIHRITGPNRQHSISKRSKEMNHKRKPSRGSGADWLRRIQNDDRLRSIPMDRKALSMEPSTDFGKRWEDLIDAADQAASIAGDIEDRTPLPQSPVSITGGSIPPFSNQAPSNNYQASPLQQALTPPSYTQEEPFPSVESGDNFHMGARGLSASSPTFSSQNTQIYCAACQNASLLRNSYACTECICGFCGSCVEILMAEHGARRKCPRCATIGGRFKPFQLEIR